MAKAQHTRQRLLRAGTRLMLRTGYRGTGVQDILQAAGVPKGSFYHFFSTKEALGLEALHGYFAEHRRVLDQFLGDLSKPPLERLRGYFDSLACSFEESGWTTGCLIGHLSQELAGENDAFRDAIAEIYEEWRGRIADCLREAQAAGELDRESDPVALADFALHGWEGAIQHMKVARSDQPLRQFQQVLFGTVLRR